MTNMGFIYMLTSPKGKKYIGQTIQPILKRFAKHQLPSSRCKAILGAINKYGWENFKKDWYECPDEDLNELEEYLVEALRTLAPGGYNLKEGGGSHGKMSAETKQKMSEAKKGEKNPMYEKTGENNPNYKRACTKDTKEKISKSLFGRTLSKEHKKKISKSKMGKKNPMYGKTLSKETKEKVSGAKHPSSKKVYQYTLNGTYVNNFGSIREAARALEKKGDTKICGCALGNRKTAYGFKWSYTEL